MLYLSLKQKVWQLNKQSWSMLWLLNFSCTSAVWYRASVALSIGLCLAVYESVISVSVRHQPSHPHLDSYTLLCSFAILAPLSFKCRFLIYFAMPSALVVVKTTISYTYYLSVNTTKKILFHVVVGPNACEPTHRGVCRLDGYATE